MRILFVCDWLITFILNEIVELKEMGNEVYILPKPHDVWVKHHIITPILNKNELRDKIFLRSRSYKNRKQKLVYLISAIINDLFKYPVTTLRGLYYMLRIYPRLGYGTECYLDMRKIFNKKIDVIHSPFSTAGILDKVYYLSKSMNVPYTLSFRAHDIYLNNAQHEIQKRIEIIRKASHIITISSYNKNILEGKLNINGDIDIIHGSINTDLFKPNNESRSPRSIVTVCRLDIQKGLIYLLEACDILNKRNVEYECTIIGEGPEKVEYEKRIKQLQIPNIHFIDFLKQEEIIKYLNRATVFVLPCIVGSDGRRDILANSLKEAMSMKLPVITSNICGIEELVDDGINGILVPPKSPDAIAEAIIKLFSEPDLRKRMGEEGRDKIKRDFNVRIEVRKLEKILRNSAKMSTDNIATNHYSRI